MEAVLTAWVIVQHALVQIIVHLVHLDSIFDLQIIPAKAVPRLLALARAAIQQGVSLAFQDTIY